MGGGKGGERAQCRGVSQLSYDPKLVNLPDICYLKSQMHNQKPSGLSTVSTDYNPFTA